MHLQLGNSSLSESRPYLNLTIQELLDQIQTAFFDKDELQQLRHELSFRNDRCKKAATALINGAIRLNNNLIHQSIAPKQPNPEFLTLDQAYEILGLNDGCSIAEVISARSKLRQELHPTKLGNLPPRVQTFVDNERNLIDFAYELIDQYKILNSNNNEELERV